MGFCGNELRPISRELLNISIYQIILRNTCIITPAFPKRQWVNCNLDAWQRTWPLNYNISYLVTCQSKHSRKIKKICWFQSCLLATCAENLVAGKHLVDAWALKAKGLPYIPRVHLSECSLVRSPLKWLWSEEPMIRRSFIPKFLYSESCYVPKIPYSVRPSTIWILCYEDSLVRSSSSPKGAMFRTSIFRKSPLPHTGSILRSSFSPKFPQF